MRPVSQRCARLAVLAIVLLVPVASLAADGGVHLYLQPLPTDAARLSFTIESISAFTSNGSEYPIKLNLPVVRQQDASRQRLLASGRLPIGTYAGFLVRVKNASLKGNAGDGALSLSEAPSRIDGAFVVAAQQSLVFWLTLRYQESLSGVTFTPVFSPGVPPKPIADHSGFVSNSGSNTITVFDKRIGQAVAVIETCAGPSGMALDQRRRTLYVACTKDDEVQSIDVATGGLVERSRLSPGDRPRELALSPDGLSLLSVNTGSNSVSIFDAVSLARGDRINVGSGPGSVVIEPSGQRAFVLNTLSNSVTVIDVPGRRALATVSTESAPLRAAFSVRGEALYIVHERSPYMTVLDTRQLTLAPRVRLRIGVSAIAVDTVRNLLCIGSENDPAIEFYDPNALMPLFSMKTTAGVSYLAFVAEDNSLYMVSPGTRSASIAKLTDRKVVAEIDTGDAPYAVTVMGQH